MKEQKEETHEPPSSEISEVEVVHEEDRNSLQSDSEKYQETSHEYEEDSIENPKYELEEIQTLMLWKRNLNCLLMKVRNFFKEPIRVSIKLGFR